jgi:hypothetical protein
MSRAGPVMKIVGMIALRKYEEIGSAVQSTQKLNFLNYD